ncbi:MAG: 5-formyltetrahydrofolate cyclo-ligase [Ruminococcaceae bacterium]|nr:5-formyltetrahydrofolate cyclo-ligase [Oscillospiraceae bacterium]
MNKEQLRKQYKAVRRETAHKAQKSESICEKVKNLSVWRTASVVALYAPLPDEVDTVPLIRAALQAGKTVCLPKLSGKEMQFYQITPDCTYSAGAFGILEPCSDILIEKGCIDIMIVPLLAADDRLYRLGFGGGYYDRYLRDYTGFTVGICFSEQISPASLPHEAHDIPLKLLISEK